LQRLNDEPVFGDFAVYVCDTCAARNALFEFSWMESTQQFRQVGWADAL
jgi:hypothetical protein